ncbi:MAG: twin-arginine translocase TatA/TatE family subunit [Bdellovibrionota bacterium]
MLHSFSFGELALIFGIILVLFGGSRLASIGKSLGEGISNFKKGLNAPMEEKPQQAAAQVASEPKLQVVHNVQIDSLQNSSRMQHVVDVEAKEVNKG